MTQQQRTQERKKHSAGPGDDAPPAPGGGGLLGDSKKYGNVARKSRKNCQTGQAAEQELRKRRNRSGQ